MKHHTQVTSPTPTISSSHTPMGTPPAYKRVEHKDRKTTNNNNRTNDFSNNSNSKNQSEVPIRKDSMRSIFGKSPISKKTNETSAKPRVAMPTGKKEANIVTKPDTNKFSIRKEKKQTASLPEYLARHVTPSPDYPLITTPNINNNNKSNNNNVEQPAIPSKTKYSSDMPHLPPRTTPSPDYLGSRAIPSPDYLSSR